MARLASAMRLGNQLLLLGNHAAAAAAAVAAAAGLGNQLLLLLLDKHLLLLGNQLLLLGNHVAAAAAAAAAAGLGNQLLLLLLLMLLLLQNMRRWMLQNIPVVARNVILTLVAVAEVLCYALTGHLLCQLEVRGWEAHQGEFLGVSIGGFASHTCTDGATASADLISLPWQDACISALFQVKGPCI